MELLFKLLIGHAIADFGLQTEAIAKGKNPNNPPFNVPPGQRPVAVWLHYLTAHALIHAGAVYVVTNNSTLALIELFAHWMIDYLKCANIYNPNTDQLLHIGCKISYWLYLI